MHALGPSPSRFAPVVSLCAPARDRLPSPVPVARCARDRARRLRRLIDLGDEPAFAGLRISPHGPGVIVGQATLLLEPLTGSFVTDDTLGRGVQKPFTAELAYLLLGAAIAGLFARPLRWPHVLGLVIVPTLFVGGLALGAGLAITYGIDPSMSGRYGLSAAPLLALVLAASLRGAWVIGAVGAFAAASFATTLLVLAV